MEMEITFPGGARVDAHLGDLVRRQAIDSHVAPAIVESDHVSADRPRGPRRQVTSLGSGFVIDPAGTLVHKVDLELPAPVMMHDFLLTEEHVVFMDSRSFAPYPFG